MKKAKPGYAFVPRLLPAGGTMAVLGSGPSLAAADVDLLRGRVDGVIAVNNAYVLAPWATALYAADGKWWKWHNGACESHVVERVTYPAFPGLKYCLAATKWKDVQVLRRGPEVGLTADPSRVALGRNGVYQAINLAVHFGATRILLLGVDMANGQRADGKGSSDHFFGHHPDHTAPQFSLCLERFPTMLKPLADLGVEVLNCSRRTALKAFPLVSLEEALALPVAVSA